MALSGGSGSNLVIGVRADASKLRADLALAQAQVGALGKELRAAANESLKTGDTTAIQGLSNAFENARSRVTGLRGEIAGIAGVGQHFAPAHRAVADMHTGFGNVTASVSNLVNTLLPGIGSKATLGVGVALAALVKLGTGAAHGITELENLSKVSGFAITTLEGLKDVFKGVVDRDDINKGVVRFSEELAKARLEASKLGPEVVKGVTVIRAGMAQAEKAVGGGFRQMVGEVEVLRGAGKQVRDVGDSFKAVGVDVRNFTKDTAGSEAALIAFSKGLSAIPDKTEQARIGVEMFGKQWALMGAGFLDLDKTLPDAIGQNLKAGLGITPQMLADAKQYRKDVADLGDAWEEASRKVGSTLVPAMTFAVQKTGESFENMRVTAQAFGGLMTAVWEKMRLDHGATMDAIVAAATTAIPILQTAWQAYFQFQMDMNRTVFDLVDGLIQRQIYWVNYFIGLVQQAWQAVSGLFSSGPAASAPIPPQNNAGGGFIRGAGSGTSDSILSWLSNGEFVMSARAVQRVGVGFLDAINGLRGFSLGGMVDAPRFATGDMVETIGAAGGGGRSGFTLVLDGRSFSAHSDEQTAQSLLRVARKRQILSAGRKPSTQG